jgi:hypothetical protein
LNKVKKKMAYIFIGYIIVIFLRYYGFITPRDEMGTHYLIKNNEINGTNYGTDYRRGNYSI